MAKKTSQPGSIHLRIIEVMKRFPGGISGGRIRQELKREGISFSDLDHLRRRIRELDEWFIIERTAISRSSKGNGLAIGDEERITETLKAEILYLARGHCQRCGKTIKEDSITLQVHRKRPEYSGDIAYRDNLWAICEECAAGKKANLVRPMFAGARPRFRRCRMSRIGRET